MRLSRFTKIGMGVVGVLFLAWAAFMVFLNQGATKSGPAVTDPNRCPVCGRDLPPAYVGTGECPYCAAAHPGEGPTRHTGSSVAANPAVPAVLIGLFCVLLTVNLFVTFRGRRGPVEEALYHLTCPKCHRKLRFRESQAGRLAACPLCRRPIVFPRLDRPPDTHWARVKRWLGRAVR
jgi:hypothetical protein